MLSTDRVDELREEITELYPYFRTIATNTIKADADYISRHDPPETAFADPGSIPEVVRLDRLEGMLYPLMEDGESPSSHIIANASEAVENMQKIFSTHQENGQWYGEPRQYLDESKTRSGVPIWKTERLTVKNALDKLDGAMDRLGISLDIDPAFAEAWGMLKTITEKYMTSAERMATASPEKYAAMTDRGGVAGTKNRKSEEIVEVTGIRDKYEKIQDPTDAQKALADIARGISEIAEQMDLSRQWKGRPAVIAANKTDFDHHKEVCAEALKKISEGSAVIRSRYHDVVEGALDSALDEAFAEEKLGSVKQEEQLTARHTNSQSHLQESIQTSNAGIKTDKPKAEALTTDITPEERKQRTADAARAMFGGNRRHTQRQQNIQAPVSRQEAQHKMATS